MFYRKTDIEILCETLITLVDKHDKALSRNGPLAAVPHARAIELIMKKIDEDLKKPVQKTKEVIKKEVDKMTEPVRRFTNGKKKLKPAISPTITVIHGAADDAKPIGQKVTQSTQDIINTLKEKEEPAQVEPVSIEAVQNAPELSEPQKPTAQDALGSVQNEQELPKPIENTDTTPLPEFVAPSILPKFHSDGTPVQETVEVANGIVTPNNIDQLTSQLPD